MKYEEMLAFSGFLNKTQGTDSPEWKEAMQKVNDLMEAMGPYQLAQGDGTYRPITPRAYENIEKKFDEAVAAVRKFTKVEANTTEDEVRLQLMKNFNKEFLAKSYIEYKNVKPNPNQSLRESMENFRYENVEVSSEELRRVGGNMSSRIQLSVDFDGVPTRGVFTARSNYEPRAQYVALLDEMEAKYGKFASFWTAIDDVRFFEGGFSGATASNFMNQRSGLVYDDTPEHRTEAMRTFKTITALDLYGEANEEFEKYRNDPDFFNALFDFTVKAEQLTISIGVNEELVGLNPGENIDCRNSAMSSVANLLGVNDLIAKSKQLAVKMPDGTFQTGTFMEFVDGKDLNQLDGIDEMRIAPLEAYEGKQAKIQLANLQVLDYVCGNVDRHLGNMLYKFDPETHKLTSIKGIDNDASFLKRHLRPGDNIAQLSGIRNMRVIDEAMAQKLLQVDEGMFTATLHGYGLSEEEISAAYERLHDLQEAVRTADTYDPEKGLPPFDASGEGYGLTIVKSEDWEKLSLNELSAGNNNFAKIISAQRLLTTAPIVTQGMKQNLECSKRALATMLKPEDSKSLYDSAKSHKPYLGVSARYQRVLDAMEAYQNAPVPEDPIHSDGHPKWDRLSELKAAVDAYKREKTEIGHLDDNGNPAENIKGKALARIEDVDKIGKFADKLLEQRKKTIAADRTLLDTEQKQRELDAFKALPPNEQQIILDQKRAHEELLKQDLAVRVQNSLAAEEESVEEDMDVEVNENLSMDAMHME
ncbi:MAG: hypothetical protein E7182_03565 [Erysipelotrichaceae bacterium]|nr:hypothetical protein [Erysipelotrichaceae bacterium]